MIKTKSGFTLVELLIVIVIIAILAAITIVAYNGIQARARYSAVQQELSDVNKAIQMYYVDNGSYPNWGASWTSTGSNLNMLTSFLVPKYISKLPPSPSDRMYIYISQSNGSIYKLICLMPSGTPLPSVELSNSGLDFRTNPDGSKRGWGYWSAGGSSL